MSSLAVSLANIREKSPSSLYSSLLTSFDNTPASNNGFGNSKICKFYRQGICTRGLSCPFQHDQSFSNRNNELYSVTDALAPSHSLSICSFYLKGKCNRGSSCKFIHEKIDDSSVRSTKIVAETSASSSTSRPVCQYFAKGYCSRGTSCHFIHERISIPHSQSLPGKRDVRIQPSTLIPSGPKEKPSIEAIRARALKAKSTTTQSLSEFAPRRSLGDKCVKYTKDSQHLIVSSDTTFEKSSSTVLNPMALSQNETFDKTCIFPPSLKSFSLDIVAQASNSDAQLTSLTTNLIVNDPLSFHHDLAKPKTFLRNEPRDQTSLTTSVNTNTEETLFTTISKISRDISEQITDQNEQPFKETLDSMHESSSREISSDQSSHSIVDKRWKQSSLNTKEKVATPGLPVILSTTGLAKESILINTKQSLQSTKDDKKVSHELEAESNYLDDSSMGDKKAIHVKTNKFPQNLDLKHIPYESSNVTSSKRLASSLALVHQSGSSEKGSSDLVSAVINTKSHFFVGGSPALEMTAEECPIDPNYLSCNPTIDNNREFEEYLPSKVQVSPFASASNKKIEVTVSSVGLKSYNLENSFNRDLFSIKTINELDTSTMNTYNHKKYCFGEAVSKSEKSLEHNPKSNKVKMSSLAAALDKKNRTKYGSQNEKFNKNT